MGTIEQGVYNNSIAETLPRKRRLTAARRRHHFSSQPSKQLRYSFRSLLIFRPPTTKGINHIAPAAFLPPHFATRNPKVTNVLNSVSHKHACIDMKQTGKAVTASALAARA
jgi:hypothetical protein